MVASCHRDVRIISSVLLGWPIRLIAASNAQCSGEHLHSHCNYYSRTSLYPQSDVLGTYCAVGACRSIGAVDIRTGRDNRLPSGKTTICRRGGLYTRSISAHCLMPRDAGKRGITGVFRNPAGNLLSRVVMEGVVPNT